MSKKSGIVINALFVIGCLIILIIPFVFANRGTAVSENENRTLSAKPSLFVKAGDSRAINPNFASEYEAWLKDNLGFRNKIINLFARCHYSLFGKMDDANLYLGENGNWIYGTKAILDDYLHLNLRSDKEVEEIGNSFQFLSDLCRDKGAAFFYVQCCDKHTVYPEAVMKSIVPLDTGESKTDQVMDYLKENTSVHSVYLKDALLEKKQEGYEVYSNWGDPNHWTPRGAYYGYLEVMKAVNEVYGGKIKVLNEEDYHLSIVDQGKTYFDSIHQPDYFEQFTIKAPQAVPGNKEGLGAFSQDGRHRWFVNENAGNDLTLLIVGDSYFNSFIVDDFAESFQKTYLIWADYTSSIFDAIDAFAPDIVIYECAERVDRTKMVVALAQELDIYPISGSGSFEDPYLIRDARDLKNLSNHVAEGEEFAGKYFLQTADIDLSMYASWKPIGAFEGPASFAGIYDGGGHTVSNLFTYGNGKNNGLFGKLAGIVCNLGIESGHIRGYCVGSICSHSAAEGAIIANCYNKATVEGAGRAGGIADNFSAGMILGCMNFGEVVGQRDTAIKAGICSYNAALLSDCYYSALKPTTGNYRGAIENGGIITDFDLSLLNEAIPRIQEKIGVELKKW